MPKDNNQQFFNNAGFKTVSKVGKVTTVISTAQDIQQFHTFLDTNDPYYTHMPKNDVAAATAYSARMGGESHEITCDIF
jgi:hypothetical protein